MQRGERGKKNDPHQKGLTHDEKRGSAKNIPSTPPEEGKGPFFNEGGKRLKAPDENEPPTWLESKNWNTHTRRKTSKGGKTQVNSVRSTREKETRPHRVEYTASRKIPTTGLEIRSGTPKVVGGKRTPGVYREPLCSKKRFLSPEKENQPKKKK